VPFFVEELAVEVSVEEVVAAPLSVDVPLASTF
jgi:hypothetical protein